MADYPKPPKTDNEYIKIYEKQFREKEKDGAKNLFLRLRDCAKRFVMHERKMKGFFITDEDAMEKATIAAEYIMTQYLTRPDFVLTTPSAYIRLRVLAALYRHKKIDELVSFTDREY